MSKEEKKKFKEFGDSGVALNTLCETCAHRDPEEPYVCKAFPEGIPTAIFLGLFDHRFRWLIGDGDNGIVYEQRQIDQPEPLNKKGEKE